VLSQQSEFEVVYLVDYFFIDCVVTCTQWSFSVEYLTELHKKAFMW